MQSESDFEEINDGSVNYEAHAGTLYKLAMQEMKAYIDVYLDLVRDTKGFSDIEPENVPTTAHKLIVLGGIGSPLDASTVSARETVQEWLRMRAVPFEVESAITRGVYIGLRSMAEALLTELEAATNSFTDFSPTYIASHPYMLPVLQRLANIASKAELKKKIGSASDNSVSLASAQKLSNLLNARQPGRVVSREQLLQSMEPTLEGIVRDLVGRVLLESVVANALDAAGVPYKRESEYNALQGVVYDFRADFVIPDDRAPKAFIEVRKSSQRHASLYAKDKMFSAINWKGKNKDLMAILVAEGPWTGETLRVMANVFDYVVPLSAALQVAEEVLAYLNGDRSKLRWLINFAILQA